MLRVRWYWLQSHEHSARGRRRRALWGEAGFEYTLSSLTPDGAHDPFSQWYNRDKIGDLMTLALGKDQRPVALMTTPASEILPRLSPTGQAVAYLELMVNTPLANRGTLKVVTFPSPSSPVPVSAAMVTSDYGWLGDNELAWIDTSRRVVSDHHGQGRRNGCRRAQAAARRQSA